MLTRSKARKARKLDVGANVHSPTTVKEVVPKEVFDITKLNREALFSLLLTVEPHEIGVVCYSKNSRVREICSSGFFQEAYKKRHPKRLMVGKIGEISAKFDPRGGKTIRTGTEFEDSKGNKLKIKVDEKSQIKEITFTPYKQIYPLSYELARETSVDLGKVTEEQIAKKITSLEKDLHNLNPIQIKFDKVNNKFAMTIGRNEIYSVLNENREEFLKRYPIEVKDFLKYIERERWWNDSITHPHNNFATREAMIEFVDEVYRFLANVHLFGNEPAWEVFKPQF